MCKIALEIPKEVLYDVKMSKEDAEIFAKRAVALCYYVQNGVSLGYCAKIAGMSKPWCLSPMWSNQRQPK